MLGPAIIGLVEQPSGALEVTGPLSVGLRVPLGALTREEVTPIDMEGHRKLAAGIGNCMDGVLTEDEDLTSRELSATSRLEAARSSAEEGVVLLSPVHPDSCPHAMLVGIEGHSWGPGDMEHRQVRGVVQSRDTAALDWSEQVFESGSIGNEFRQDVPHGQDRRVLGQRHSASSDDVLDRESHELRLRPSSTRQRSGAAHGSWAGDASIGVASNRADRPPGNLPPATFGGNGFAVLPEFSISARDLPDIHVVALHGELDVVSADGLADELVEVAGPTLVVDLSDLTFMDCRGIAALVVARNRILANGLGQLVVTRPGAIVRKTLEIVGLGAWIMECSPTLG